MTVQNAMDFISQVGRDKHLRQMIQKNPYRLDLEDTVRIGADHGFEFNVSELRQAFAKDWLLRRRFFSDFAV